MCVCVHSTQSSFETVEPYLLCVYLTHFDRWTIYKTEKRRRTTEKKTLSMQLNYITFFFCPLLVSSGCVYLFLCLSFHGHEHVQMNVKAISREKQSAFFSIFPYRRELALISINCVQLVLLIYCNALCFQTLIKKWEFAEKRYIYKCIATQNYIHIETIKLHYKRKIAPKNDILCWNSQ